MTAGVPQGSILGPIMFLLFINNLPLAAQSSTVDICADDTTLSFSSDVANGLHGITSALQQDLDDLSRWLAANKLVTKCLPATGKRLANKIVDGSLNFHLGNSNIEQVDSQKLQGLTTYRQLSINVHVEKLCKRLSQRITVPRKIGRFLPIEQRILYYNAMIKQLMLYGFTVWSNCSSVSIMRVFKLQKRAIRVILEVKTSSNSIKLFKKLSWLPFFDEIK